MAPKWKRREGGREDEVSIDKGRKKKKLEQKFEFDEIEWGRVNMVGRKYGRQLI